MNHLSSHERTQQQYFNTQSHQYDVSTLLSPPAPLAIELQGIKNALSCPPGSTLIDFGSGSGRVSLYFLKRGYSVHAVDISDISLKRLVSVYNTYKTSTWGNLTTSPTIPPAITVDGVVGADILHHVTIPTYLPVLKKALKRGSRMVFSEPNGLNVLWYLYLAALRIPWHIERNITTCTIWNLRRKFEKAGLIDIHIQGVGILPLPLTGWSNTLTRINARLGNIPFITYTAFRLLVSGVNK